MFAIANSIILLHYKYSFFPQHKGFKLSKSLKIGLRIPSHITCVRPETFAPGLYWGFPTAVFLIITHIGWVPRISEAFFFFLVLFALNAWCFYADFRLPVYNLFALHGIFSGLLSSIFISVYSKLNARSRIIRARFPKASRKHWLQFPCCFLRLLQERPRISAWLPQEHGTLRALILATAPLTGWISWLKRWIGMFWCHVLIEGLKF